MDSYGPGDATDRENRKPRPERRPKRNANGEGTVYRRKDGRWCIAVFVLQPDGTRKRKYLYGRTRQEVRRKRTELLRKVDRGIPVPTRSPTVAAYLEHWLTTVAARKLRPNTLRSYDTYVRLYLVPGLGKKRLDQLQARDVRLWLDQVRQTCRCCDQGKDSDRPPQRRRCCALGRCCRDLPSARTVQYLHAILRSALQHAVREEELDRNVAKNVQVPGGHRPEIQPLTVDEARQLLATARSDRLHALYVLALLLGLRRGELLGLPWSDVNLTDGVLQVRQTLHRAQGRLYFSEPKTPRSRRPLPLPDPCVQALRNHRERQQREREAAGGRWHGTGLVFTTAIGTPIEPRNLNRAFTALLRRAGLRHVRLHDLRHTTATLLRADGVDLRVIMQILGHSALAVTSDTYSHVALDEQREALRRLGQLA